MKNVEKDQVRACITISSSGFEKALKDIYKGQSVEVDIDTDSLSVFINGDEAEDLVEKLEEYYEIQKITSVRALINPDFYPATVCIFFDTAELYKNMLFEKIKNSMKDLAEEYIKEFQDKGISLEDAVSAASKKLAYEEDFDFRFSYWDNLERALLSELKKGEK